LAINFNISNIYLKLNFLLSFYIILLTLFLTQKYAHFVIDKELLHSINLRELNSNCREVIYNKNTSFLKQNGFELDFQTNQLRKSVYSNLIKHKIH
jgi:hypothetical protein